ncbi:Multiple EGFlike-domains 10, putative [Acanthamoeba castellanii str. Neff]|uniref:Multiple EGFlike-domains 10, putative n=1 Tax=Acanthamoeba castellanii (strain ATCC 30010 / Neff) TaxID=1257118 RepID=L8HE61_ACACF|nr:Multiple EGFlike-domains 10, putative [Acanthamoeba castellanii str. Neff]ELR23824.1 Multiple EGFlike-domains 10, putative [Acanthamoeba castellanii str. Neff]
MVSTARNLVYLVVFLVAISAGRVSAQTPQCALAFQLSQTITCVNGGSWVDVSEGFGYCSCPNSCSEGYLGQLDCSCTSAFCASAQFNLDCTCDCTGKVCYNSGTVTDSCGCLCNNTCLRDGLRNSECGCQCYYACANGGQLNPDCSCECSTECVNGGYPRLGLLVLVPHGVRQRHSGVPHNCGPCYPQGGPLQLYNNCKNSAQVALCLVS